VLIVWLRYNVRVSGIFQSTPSAFLPGPLGSGDRDFRGSIESRSGSTGRCR
jgi:LPS-assembly protein